MTRKTDMQLLTELLEDQRLSDRQRDIFQGFKDKLHDGAWECLTPNQRKWVTEVHERLELGDGGCANIVSSGAVRVDPRERMRVFAWEQMERPIRPPGR